MSAPMVIVEGHITVEPQQRESYRTVSVQEYDIADVAGRVREGGRVNSQHRATLDR